MADHKHVWNDLSTDLQYNNRCSWISLALQLGCPTDKLEEVGNLLDGKVLAVDPAAIVEQMAAAIDCVVNQTMEEGP